MKKLLAMAALGAVGFLSFGQSGAKADVVLNATLNQSGCCGSGPFGTVNIDQSATGADLVFTIGRGVCILMDSNPIREIGC